MHGHQGRVEFEGGISTGVMDRWMVSRGGLNLRVESAPVMDRWMDTKGGLNLKAESTPE